MSDMASKCAASMLPAALQKQTDEMRSDCGDGDCCRRDGN